MCLLVTRRRSSGHTRISITLEIYTHTDEPGRHDALTRLPGLLDRGQN
jgi:hypothetical protein